MEKSSDSPKGLQWEDFSLFCGKNNEILGFSSYDLGIGSSSSSSSSKDNPFSASSSKQGMDSFWKLSDSLSPYRQTYGSNNVGTVLSSGSNEPIVGLRLGRQKENGGDFPARTSVPLSSMVTKRTRTTYQNMQNPCCQVEGCNLELRSAKDYHRRHRICETHSKSPKVVVGGMERRFCQQCSRFHDLSEFDDKKRSCRRRLSDHNARRRRLPPEALHHNRVGLASALYDMKQQNIFLNGLPISVPNTWDNMLRQDSFPMHTSGSEFQSSLCFTSKEIPSPVSSLNDDSGLNIHTSGSSVAPDLHIAHSLLSPNSWSLKEGKSASSEYQIMPGNEIWGHFQSSDMIAAQQGPPLSRMHSIDMQNGGTPQLQEFQLFKSSYESGCYYSSQRN